MTHQDDLHTAGMSEDQPVMELLDGAVQGTPLQRSSMGRLLRGSLYGVLLLFASVLLAISAVPELASYVTFFSDTKAGASRSSQSSALIDATFNPSEVSADSPHSKDELKAAIKALGGRWSSHGGSVSFSGTQATDADLEYVKWISSLEELRLSDTQITDAGLALITGLRNLEEVDVSKTQITNAGLEHLKGLPRLRSVRLSGTQVTDAAIEILQNMSALQSLDISETQITEAGLEHLQEITNLKKLYVSPNQFTEAGIEKLTTALPECRILRN